MSTYDWIAAAGVALSFGLLVFAAMLWLRLGALEAKIDRISIPSSDFSDQISALEEALHRYLVTALFDHSAALERKIDEVSNAISDVSEQSGQLEELRTYLATTLFDMGDRLSEGEAQLDRIEAAIGAIDSRVP